ncbi:tyrosine-type recombinase/integrase [Nocardioides sp. SOB77]|uniref:Tyrosine-type recombinase/integrase n=1 Tax=Nocardioides oceani TaxID=3058369 RepID=A0ABT8FJZ2_9ACTN|nr:tyrosine-type recombinase/integrase [Nocardioides oceani]MDN4174765.1 tyrosine-type recombinase/integrase [Nocardioides oceani]
MDLLTYESWLTEHGLCRNTVDQRVAFVGRRLKAWGTLDLPPSFVVEWLLGYRGWTRRTYLMHLRSVYAWMVETGQIEVSPVSKMRPPPTPAPRPRPLTADALNEAMSAAQGHLRTWLLLGYLLGLRCHEIAKVRGEHVSETTFYVLGKGGREAELPTHPALWALAQEYPRTGWWFPSVQARRDYISESQIGNKVRAHFRELGIESGSVHRLRHTYCTTLARNGVQPRVIQELMRHSSLDTTMRYMDVLSEERAAAVRTLSPGWTTTPADQPAA